MTKKEIKELEEKIKNYKPKYVYNRYDGQIRKYEVVDNLLINVKNSNDIIDRERYGILGEVSENIIDLIEVGDYVNGMLVIQVIHITKGTVDLPKGTYILCDKDEKCMYPHFRVNKIESVVTKEQFKRMEYKMED